MKKNLLIIVLLFAVCLSQAQSFKFAVICDTRSDANNSGTSGVNVSAVKAVCQHLVNDGAEFVLAPGDFICGNVNWYLPQPPSNDTQYQAFLEAARSQGVGLPKSNAKVTLYPTRGNHECYHDILPEDSVKASWLRNIGYSLPNNGHADEIGFTYSIILNKALFIGLDQYMSTYALDSNDIKINQAWLDSVLQQNTDIKHVFAFGHTPAFAAKHQDCLGSDSLNRDTLLQSIKKQSGVYFCGHDHFYARAKVPVYSNGGIENYIQQVITPSGAPFLTGSRDDNHKWEGVYTNTDVIQESYIDNALGYQLITVNGNEVTVEFKATQDASTFIKDCNGVYHYIFNYEWETWTFATMDKFTYNIPLDIKK